MIEEYVRVVPVLIAQVTQVVETSFMLDGAVRDKSLLEVRLCDVVQELCLSACNPLAELTTKVSVLSSCPPSVEFLHEIMDGANVHHSSVQVCRLEITSDAAEAPICCP